VIRCSLVQGGTFAVPLAKFCHFPPSMLVQYEGCFPRAFLCKAPEHFIPMRGALLRGLLTSISLQYEWRSSAQAGIHPLSLSMYQWAPNYQLTSSTELQMNDPVVQYLNSVKVWCRRDE
jgi:hypothetical protein